MLRVLGLAFALLGITAIVDAAPVQAATNDVALTGRVTSAADEFIEYPLPEQATNIRRVFIDNSDPRPAFGPAPHRQQGQDRWPRSPPHS